MRRIFAIVLLVAFVLQATGSTSASQGRLSANLAPFRVELATALAGVATGFQGTQFFALISGNEARYAAMHAPPPQFNLNPRKNPVDLQTTFIRHDVARKAISPGRPGPALIMLAKPPTPQALQSLQKRVAQEYAHPSTVRPVTMSVVKTAGAVRVQNVNTSVSSTTGINPWWTYEEGGISGDGKWMLNVGTGNMIVQSDDIDIHERGIDLAFRRTYNEQSQHDYNNTDGSTMDNYGEGWTNTFDVHLGYDSTADKISVYDIDGARYDYSWNGSAWVPPVGQYASLQTDGVCGFYWTKKSGTMYYFTTPALAVSPNCPYTSAVAGAFGRIYMIYGRNRNNNIVFTYSWTNGDISSDANLTQIIAQHSSGDALTLTFADNASGQRLLYSITEPNGQVVRYAYDGSGDLTDVCDIGNGNTDNSPGAASICGDTSHRHHRYGWAGDHVLYWADSPNYTMEWGAGPAGMLIAPSFDSSNRLSVIADIGNVNYTPDDGTNTLLQPSAPTGVVYNNAEGFYYSSGQTDYQDWNGHAVNYLYDASDRVTETQDYTGSLWLVTNAQWDSNNNLVASIDARGNETDFAFDLEGNTIAVALPAVTTSAGTFRPTSLYSYDGNNNLVSYCDPVFDNPSRNWTAPPVQVDSLCPTTPGGGSTVYVYTIDGNEPFGMLTDSYSPMGYHTQITYAPGGASGDSGLPTAVQGATFSQVDGTVAAPAQGFQYDSHGNLVAYTKLGTTPSAGNESVLTYDSLNRPTSVTDPDGQTSYTYYYNDGEVFKSETPAQHALGMGSTVQYDADGNAIKSFSYVGGAYVAGGSPTLTSTPSETDKYYDGDDRLVEVVAPHDPSDVYDTSWITRYDYDLSQNGTAMTPTFDGYGTVTAHGNLFKTQELLPSTSGGTLTLTMPSTGTFTTLHPAQFVDIKGGNFDALDRPTIGLTKVNQGSSGEVTEQATTTYDNPAAVGLPYQSCNAMHQCSTLGYDALGRAVAITFSDTLSPNRSTTYDPDGRVATIASAVYGAQTYTYDNDGHLTKSVEPSGGGVTSPATLNYHYYPNGWKESLDVTSSSFNQTGLFTYSYRNDGLVQTRQINDAGNSLVGSTSLAFTHSPAGRLQQRTEAGLGANAVPIVNSYDSYGRVSAIQYPAGTYGNIEYDATGHQLGSVGGYTASPLPTTMAYTQRGELNTLAAVAPTPVTLTAFANGVGVTLPQSGFEGTDSWDPQMGVLLSTESDSGQGPIDSSSVSVSSFSFDAAGRNTEASSEIGGSVNVPGGGTQDIFDTVTATKTYDDENHLISATQSASFNHASRILAYSWGPNGHPIQIGSTPTGVTGTQSNIAYETLHWDGDQLLFTTNSAGALDDIKVGSIGDITPLDPGYKGLTFYDRDLSGSVGYCHNATGAAGTGAIDPYSFNNMKLGQLPRNPCAKVEAQSISAPTSIAWSSGEGKFGSNSQVGQATGGSLIGMPRPDGIADGFNTIQGVRSYDPTLGSWTTPDAYSGDVSDPGSQKSYMWNNNNPVGVMDPSGFDGIGQANLFFDPETSNGGEGPLAYQDNVDADAKLAGLNEGDIDLLNHGATSGYSTAPAAAFAAGIKYTLASSEAQAEYGVPIYKDRGTGTFGYGGLTIGTISDVETRTDAIPSGTDVVGIWHNHPRRGDVLDHTGNLQDFRTDNPGRAFMFFTSVEGEFISQGVDAKGNIQTNPTIICNNCMPMPMNSETD